jgi:hypothetical protein
MKSRLVSALAVAVAELGGCGGARPTIPTAPVTESPPAAAAAPTATEVIVSGQTSLSFVGQTTQLIAVAKFSDGSNRGITGEALWTSSDPSVLAVSATGLVTVVRFGRVYISATYDTKSAGQTIEAIEPERVTSATPAEFLQSSCNSAHGAPGVKRRMTPS